MANFTEREIVSGLKTGLRVDAIISFLYNRYFRVIRNLVHKWGGNQQDSEDLFQDILIIFIEIVRVDGFTADGKATLQTYLYSIASRLLQKRQNRKIKEEAWVRQFMNDQGQIEDAMVRYEDHLTAIQLLDQLPEACQHLLYGYYVEGYSLQEMATKMNSTEGAVRQQKFRCLKKLKDLL